MTEQPSSPLTDAHEQAKALLAGGGDVINLLGQRAGQQTASALNELDRISKVAADLMDVNVRLVPLISSFKRVDGRQKWWHWFNGDTLEQDVFFAARQQEIQMLASQGEQAHARLLEQVAVFQSQHILMGRELALLDIDIAAGQLMLTSPYAEACRYAGLDGNGMNRLSRRVTNLEASAVAMRLTQAQYQMATAHARTVADRFCEIHTLLLPIWEQAMGFELFSRRVSAHEP